MPFSLPMSALIGRERMAPLPSVGVEPAWGHPPALEPASAPLPSRAHPLALPVIIGSWERGLCGGDWLSGWETCSLRSVKTEHRAVVLGPGLCCRGSDTLYLPPFPAFGGNQNLLCSGIRKRKGPAAVARMSLRFPGGTTVSSYPSSRFQSCRISIRFFLMT